MVTNLARENQFNRRPPAMSAPPKIACSFHGSGRTSNTPSAHVPMNASNPHTRDLAGEYLKSGTTSVIRQPLTQRKKLRERRTQTCVSGRVCGGKQFAGFACFL